VLSIEPVFTAQDTDAAEYLRQRLYAFNGEHVPIVFEYINLYLKDECGRTCGGLLAEHYWNCLFIDILWIEPEYRRLGYGRKLMAEIEQIARDKRLDLIHLDTHGFQAPGFYAKLGYEVFGVLDDSPKGYCRYYMAKRLEYPDDGSAGDA